MNIESLYKGCLAVFVALFVGLAIDAIYPATFRHNDTQIPAVIALLSAVLLMSVSLTVLRKLSVIADGLLLGGALTLAYSALLAFNQEDRRFRLLIITFDLLVTLVVGYVKFSAAGTSDAES